MMAVNLDDVVRLAQQLEREQQNVLIFRLRVSQAAQRGHDQTPPVAQPHPAVDRWFLQRGSEFVDTYRTPTREELLDDAAVLRERRVEPESGLLGKYADSSIPEMTEEAFHADMHAIVTEWERELNDLDDDQP